MLNEEASSWLLDSLDTAAPCCIPPIAETSPTQPMSAKSSPSDRWSPMTCLPAASLTPSGLLQLDSADGEVELLTRDNCEIRCASDPIPRLPSPEEQGKEGSGTNPNKAEWIDRDTSCVATLTTHRIALASSTLGTTRFVHLSTVHSATSTGGGRMSFSSHKISLGTYSYGELLLVFRGSKGSSHAGRDRDAALECLEKALARRAWEESSKLEQKKKESAANTIAQRKVGVDAILTKNKLKHKEAAMLASEAFESDDIEKLMSEAGELVSIIKKYAATLEREGSKGADDEEDARKLSGMLEDMGMMSALGENQYSDKDGYYQTLARQLADFLRYKNRLKEAGGMMTLTDVYCLFNRARGTNMISPEDLLKALEEMKGLSLGMGKRKFPSGVLVVQDDEFDDDKMAKRLRSLAEESTKDGEGLGGVTALDASRVCKVPALLASEQLRNAEEMGFLCRDVTLEGTRFFPNRFKTGEFEGW